MADAGFVLVLGGANVDICAGTDHALSPGDSTPGRVRFSPGGVARNVAHNLARLGHDTRLLSAVGDDAQGRSLLSSTQQAGVDVSGCWVLADAATASYVSVHDRSGDMVLAVNDMQVLERITPDVLAPHALQLQQAAAVVVDCNLPDAALGWVFAQRGAVPVFVDAVSAFKCRRLLPWLAQVHTLKANRLEAQALSGLPVDSTAQVENAAQWLHRQGVQRVVLSLGEDGLYFSERESECESARKSEHVGELRSSGGWHPALPVTVLNTTGAGDALMAGLVHAHLAREPLRRAVRFASGCAAMTLQAATTHHPDLSVASVEALLQQHARQTLP